MRKILINVSWIRVKKVSRHTKESFVKEVLNNPARNEAILAARQETDPEKKKFLKESLPGVCWNVKQFTDGQRHDLSAVSGSFFATDYDAKDNPLMGNVREYYNQYIRPLEAELRIVWAEETVNHGLHIVAIRPENANIVQAQQHQATLIGLNHDPACKDESRLVILGHKDEIFHADWEAIFSEKELESYTIQLPEGIDHRTQTAFTISEEMIEKVRAKIFYGIELGEIFDGYVGTEMIPEGQRNTVVFGKAHKLMALGLTTEELVALFTPVTGLTQAELRLACRTQPNYVPSDGKLPNELRNTIRQIRKEKGMDTGLGLLSCRPLPKKLPPLFRVLAAVAPKGMSIQLIILSLPILGFLATKVKFTYLDGVIHFLSMMAHVIGKFAGGKSTLIKWLVSHLLNAIRERDDVARQLEREYMESYRRCKADERKPDDPKPVIRFIPITISVALLLKRLDQAKGQHLLSVCEEVDTVTKTNKAGAWSEKTDIYRVGFDAGDYGQDYMSDNSYSGIFKVLYNLVTGGTDESTRKFFGKHVMDGLISRVAFTRIIDEFAGEMPIFKKLTDKQTAEIEQGVKMLEEAEGEIKLPRTLKAIEGWIVEKRQLAVETMSPAIDALYKRSAVMGARAGAIATILSGGKENSVVVEFALFIADYVLQQQVSLWGYHFEKETESTNTCSLANLYKELPEEFTRQELINLRLINGQGSNVREIICRWKKGGMIREVEKNRYIKTQG